MLRFFSVLWLILITACTPLIPATSPPQLDYTPSGIAIRITDGTVYTDDFQMDYPDGWRIIKLSVDGSPLHLVFASPDDSMRIDLTETPLPEDQIQDYDQIEMIALDDTRKLYIYAQASEENKAIFDRIFSYLLDSIKITEALR